MIEFYRPVKYQTFRHYFMKETETSKIALKFVDSHARNLHRIVDAVKKLEDAEIYVAILEKFGQHDLSKVVRVRELINDWDRALKLTRTSLEDVIHVPMIEIDEGYRTVIVLAPKTSFNLSELKKLSKEWGAPIADYYRKDFEEDVI